MSESQWAISKTELMQQRDIARRECNEALAECERLRKALIMIMNESRSYNMGNREDPHYAALAAWQISRDAVMYHEDRAKESNERAS